MPQNDTVAISELLHKYNAFAFFDYAGVGAYTTVDMNPRPNSLAYKDGVFLSPHKLIGGPGSSGVLAARLEVFSWASNHSSPCPPGKNEYVPTGPGGGTVDMVLDGRHKYINNISAREEAGTPNILATIRAGLVFRLQEIMNPSAILAKEYKLSSAIYQRLLKQPNISILGTPELNRVAVFCAMIHIPSLSTQTRPLQIHYSLLSIIMNDFFGIEMRGGCMCAGPYASQLLQFDQSKEDKFWDLLMGNTLSKAPSSSNNNIHKQDLVNQSLKPGFVRFSFPYFVREKDVDFVLQSLEWVAEYGYLLIPFYQVDAQSGKWSLRPSVYRAVCESISAKKLNNGSRDDYIPIATACIDGLHRLFSCQTALPQVNFHAADVTDFDKPGLLHTLSQTRQSITNLLKSSMVKSISHTDVPATVNRSGDSLGSSASDPQPTISYPSSSHYSVASDTISKMSHGQSTSTKHGRPTDIKHSRGASSSSVQSSSWSSALEELSVERLGDEHSAVEICALAKELRWFATPLEVAELYTSGRVSGVLPIKR
ncbi:hypothetical protein BGZ92_011727 [Podila epicladia]|nr:hypothetical protein BGZ92_011727 [Podila epicladia]